MNDDGGVKLFQAIINRVFIWIDLSGLCQLLGNGRGKIDDLVWFVAQAIDKHSNFVPIAFCSYENHWSLHRLQCQTVKRGWLGRAVGVVFDRATNIDQVSALAVECHEPDLAIEDESAVGHAE